MHSVETETQATAGKNNFMEFKNFNVEVKILCFLLTKVSKKYGMKVGKSPITWYHSVYVLSSFVLFHVT